MVDRTLANLIYGKITELPGDLNHVPGAILKAAVKRVLGILGDVLPANDEGGYGCTVDDIFGEWVLCECGQLVQLDKATFGEDVALCPECVLDYEDSKQKPS